MFDVVPRYDVEALQFVPKMDSAARKAKNEAQFRSINEGIAEIVEHSPTIRSSRVAFVCECASDACTHAIELTLDEYEQVRASATHFVVAPGHVAPSIEHIVSKGPRYAVVEKDGVAGEIAEQLDPR
jgi:hypothetical protein